MTTRHKGDSPTDDEIRTRRLAVVDDAGNERAIIELVHGHIELRLLSGDTTNECEVLVFAGAQVAGTAAVGVELWVNGNSVGGCSAVTSGSEVEFHRFP